MRAIKVLVSSAQYLVNIMPIFLAKWNVLQVEIDVLTGEKTVLRTDINFDCGHSLNPAVDMGQVCSGSALSASCLMPSGCDVLHFRKAVHQTAL